MCMYGLKNPTPSFEHLAVENPSSLSARGPLHKRGKRFVLRIWPRRWTYLYTFFNVYTASGAFVKKRTERCTRSPSLVEQSDCQYSFGGALIVELNFSSTHACQIVGSIMANFSTCALGEQSRYSPRQPWD